jgi:hypothetical protein
MTNPCIGFIGPCDRCGARMTYSLVCWACELAFDSPGPEAAEPGRGNGSPTSGRRLAVVPTLTRGGSRLGQHIAAHAGAFGG